ncbi:ArgP/LysG family DNA-binding transcriptional regulator [Oerskovia sp. M15]
MVDLQPDQLRALDAIASTGTFEAAAQRLGVTPSAVSQRMRALESAVGQVLVRRGARDAHRTGRGPRAPCPPPRPPARRGPGRAGPRRGLHARAQARHHGDALTTWALPVLAEASAWARLEILREDQDHSIDLLRDGTAVAAITSASAAVPGCRVTPLGRMRYRPQASPEFVERWFPDGPTRAALAAAPVLVFDRKDDLQDRYLQRRLGSGPAPRRSPRGPRHHVPASHEFLRAVELGMGWGMLPDLQSEASEAAGRVTGFDDAASLSVPQYWQQWRLHSPTLDTVAAAVRAAAATHLR